MGRIVQSKPTSRDPELDVIVNTLGIVNHLMQSKTHKARRNSGVVEKHIPHRPLLLEPVQTGEICAGVEHLPAHMKRCRRVEAHRETE